MGWRTAALGWSLVLCAAPAVAATPATPPPPEPVPARGAAAPQSATPARAPPPPPPCPPLPAPATPFAFRVGETLDFDLDALGAEAGKLQLQILPAPPGELSVKATAQTHPFFSSIRRVSGVGQSHVDAKSLRPRRYEEDVTENGVRKQAEVRFRPDLRQVTLEYRIDARTGRGAFASGPDALDALSAILLLRQLRWAPNAPVCFDGYGIRKLWRVIGKVEGREHLSLPLGEFKAWHLSAVAVRLDNPRVGREVHLWISDDAKRLPLVAVGTLDLGAVRATLTRYVRPGERQVRSEGKETLKW